MSQDAPAMAQQQDDDLGARVRAARGFAGLSQAQLAEQIGLERRIVVAIEADDARHPLGVKEAREIARACRVPVSFLFNGWAAPPELLDRVTALEEMAARAEADRDIQAAEIEVLLERLEKRYAELAGQEPQTSSAPARAGNRRRRDDPPTP